jgi:tetratricopeptide (TPR) repeat protein
MTSPNTPQPTAQTLARRAEAHRQQGRYQEALADFDRAVALHPDYGWALAHRGETFFLMDRYEEALADLDRAIALNPDYAWALAHRAAVYRRLKRHPEALRDLNQALALEPAYAWALIHRANVYVVMKQYDLALADVDRVLGLDSSLIPYWRGERGLLLNYLGRYGETIDCCRPAVAENPADYIAWYSLAIASALANGVAAAQADIEQARTAALAAVETPAGGLALYRLAGLAALEGRIEAALAQFRQAITLSNEPAEVSRHDPAWDDLRPDPRFQALLV